MCSVTDGRFQDMPLIVLILLQTSFSVTLPHDLWFKLKKNEYGVILSTILSQIFNECMKTGLFPDMLKTSRLIPLHTKVDESNLSNYRPTSILTHLSKVFEKL